MKVVRFITASVLSLAALTCSVDIRLSGTVTDRAGNGLAGVGVSLVRAGVSGTTSNTGEWTLSGNTGTMSRDASHPIIRWSGNSLVMRLLVAGNVRIDAFDLMGASGFHVVTKLYRPGEYRIPVSVRKSGLTWLRVTIGGYTETIIVGTNFPGLKFNSTVSEVATRSLGVVDTLRFEWHSKLIAEMPISEVDSSALLIKINVDSSVGWNTAYSSHPLYDARDGQSYQTVKIGDQIWMAENLNFSVENSWWFSGKDESLSQSAFFNDSLASGAKYGRFYTWASFLNLPDSCNLKYCLLPDSCRSKVCSSDLFPSRRGVCPIGWHVPSELEWALLVNSAESDPRVGNEKGGLGLKSISGWLNNSNGSGTDVFGFRGRAAGNRTGEGKFFNTGSLGVWHTSREGSATKMLMGSTMFDSPRFYYDNVYSKTTAISGRCVKD